MAEFYINNLSAEQKCWLAGFIECHILIEFIKRRRRTTFVTGRGSRGQTSFTDADENSYRSLLKLNKRGP